MNSIKLILFIIVLITTSCNQNKNQILIKGEISGNPPSSVKIFELLPNGSQLIDSASIINGKFKYTIAQTSSSFYQLVFSENENFLFAATAGDKLSFSGDFTLGKRTFQMQGSKENDVFLDMNRRLDDCYKLTDSLSQILTKVMYEENYLELKTSIDQSYQNAFEHHRQWLLSVINQNPQSLISLMAYYQALGNNRFFNDITDFEIMKKMHENLVEKYTDNIHFEHFERNFERIKHETEQSKQIQTDLSIGKPIPNISFFITDKGIVNPKSYIGENLLLFFWSFVSKSSIDIIPELKNLAQQKKLKVLAVSFDKNEEKALSFATKNLDFATSANEEKMFESLAAKTYDIITTPAFILVDSDGKIVCRTYDYNELKQACEKL